MNVWNLRKAYTPAMMIPNYTQGDNLKCIILHSFPRLDCNTPSIMEAGT